MFLVKSQQHCHECFQILYIPNVNGNVQWIQTTLEILYITCNISLWIIKNNVTLVDLPHDLQKNIIFGFLIVIIMWYKKNATYNQGGGRLRKNLHVRLFVSCCINANLASWPSSWCEKNSSLLLIALIDPPHDSSISKACLMCCSFWAHASYLKPLYSLTSWVLVINPWTCTSLHLFILLILVNLLDWPLSMHECVVPLQHVPLILPSSCLLSKHALLIISSSS